MSELLQAPELAVEEVELPDIGTVRVRELSGTELALFQRKATRAAQLVKGTDEHDEAEIELAAWLVERAIDKVLDPRKLSVQAFSLLQVPALRLSGLETNAEEEAVEDFSQAPTSGTGTD